MRRTSAEREPLGARRLTPAEFGRMEAAATNALRGHGFEVERTHGGVTIVGPGYTCTVRSAAEFARDAGIRIEP